MVLVSGGYQTYAIHENIAVMSTNIQRLRIERQGALPRRVSGESLNRGKQPDSCAGTGD